MTLAVIVLIDQLIIQLPRDFLSFLLQNSIYVFNYYSSTEAIHLQISSVKEVWFGNIFHLV